MHIFLSVAIQTVPNPAAKLLLFFELTKKKCKKVKWPKSLIINKSFFFNVNILLLASKNITLRGLV